MNVQEKSVKTHVEVPYPMQSRQDLIVAAKLEEDLGTLRHDYGPVVPALMPFGEGDCWIAIGYEAVRQVMSDDRFVVWKHRGNNYPRLRFNEGNRPPFRMAFDKMDGPEQIARRRVLAKHLSARRVMGMREETRNKIENFLDGFISHGQSADVMKNFVEHVPLAVISDLLGVPADETDIFLEAALDHMNGRITSEEQANAHINKVNAYFDHLVARRHEEPGDDLISALLNDVGGTWDDEELGGVGFVLLTAGHDSTASIIGGILFWLAHDLERFEYLKNNRDVLPRAIEEFLRVIPAGTGTRVRIATEDVEIGGVVVKKDDGIHPVVHPANFDETVFENPDELNFAREGETHLRFGFGSHACPGNQLARMEIREVLDAVLNRFATFEAANPSENWRGEMLMRGPKELKVNWTLEGEEN
ncbi:cytochrome P450 [Corynebacterium glutamicum Z188]|uniref:Cytochrome n=1 Tax=Corynebacterium glutamicum TaxID=1718 RepID=A0AB36I811_CORGT|nr:cytochrome P450 [Corynebacterium glutamicum]AGN17738.1 cytochrome P450 [Corynebacterium glutamicum SCgG1]AGN20761.1 cytochrome P450 [Corynebacterium glutamicum SCgG2]EGV39962.1 cytochrome P450 [Corynebacterium glutamicum S9114]EPP42044.1 cytochrome P450 [Corynebacterium glutamicum Z188]NII88802.1 nocardicin N-oxygenase [Corynebacterium glutamicum]